tara:strand:+ start:46 stop:600 length:555 start_codon:yes stop_codon:yes gene_type:complete
MKNLDLFIENYNKKYLNVTRINSDIQRKIKDLYKLILKIKKNNKKIIIAGNGGSAAIASHFSVDMTKNGGVRCINFNESDLITCFSNDYGYENWIKEAINFYSDKGDLIILISASGESKNILNAAKFAKSKTCKLITFSGFHGKNRLIKFGDLNFAVNSKNYNFIENTHQYWLLSVVDLLSSKN